MKRAAILILAVLSAFLIIWNAVKAVFEIHDWIVEWKRIRKLKRQGPPPKPTPLPRRG